MKPTLRPPGTMRLTPKYDVPVSNFAFKFNLRRYTLALDGAESPKDGSSLPGAVLDIDVAIQQAGGDVLPDHMQLLQ